MPQQMSMFHTDEFAIIEQMEKAGKISAGSQDQRDPVPYDDVWFYPGDNNYVYYRPTRGSKNWMIAHIDSKEAHEQAIRLAHPVFSYSETLDLIEFLISLAPPIYLDVQPYAKRVRRTYTPILDQLPYEEQWIDTSQLLPTVDKLDRFTRRYYRRNHDKLQTPIIVVNVDGHFYLINHHHYVSAHRNRTRFFARVYTDNRI